jgi:ABC-2 type transport system permease protein
MRRLVDFVSAYLLLNLSSAMEYRASFISQVVGMALNDSIMIFFWWLFFQRFPQVGNWQLADVLRLWGVVAVAFGLGTAIFGNCPRIATLISTGQLDYYLSLPKDVLLHLLVSRSSTAAWGDAAFGLVAFAAAGDLRLSTVLLFAAFSLTGCAVMVAYHVLVGSLAFWIGNAESFSAQASGALINFSTYPGSIYRGWIKLLTFTLIPSAMVGHLPVELLRRFDPVLFLEVAGFAALSVLVAVVVFRRGLRRYESGNLLVLRG